MDSKSTPSDVVAARVREVRVRRDMSTADLAARCAELGAPRLTVQALYKLEGQRDPASRHPRSVTVDELLVLALALNVYPVHLLVPPDDDKAPYPVTAAVTEPNVRVRHWIKALDPLRKFPNVGDVRLLWSEVPDDEFEAMQRGQCTCCGGRHMQWVETAPGQWTKKVSGPDGEHPETP
jgi:hypothetical protein